MNAKMMCTFLAALALTCTALETQAKIYKTVDANGNVVFTDIPPKGDGETITITEHNSYTPVVTAPSLTGAPEIAQQDVFTDVESETIYETVRILSPRNNLDLRANDGTVSIRTLIKPLLDLDRGHSLQIVLDGEAVKTGKTATIALQDVDRGSHEIYAQIVGAEGDILSTSATVTFHLKRLSALAPLGPQKPGGATYNLPANRAPNVPPRKPSPAG